MHRRSLLERRRLARRGRGHVWLEVMQLLGDAAWRRVGRRRRLGSRRQRRRVEGARQPVRSRATTALARGGQRELAIRPPAGKISAYFVVIYFLSVSF